MILKMLGTMATLSLLDCFPRMLYNDKQHRLHGIFLATHSSVQATHSLGDDFSTDNCFYFHGNFTKGQKCP